jgi:tRNA pseudouridine55 synthase
MAKQCRRQISGVLLLDKPTGLSSNAALQQVKRLYFAAKAGHAGNLDPLASGLLPICFGEATKVLRFLLNANKTYRFTCRLGVTTNTGDAEGDVLQERFVEPLDPENITQVLERFIGEIQQIPPMYSALKHQGQRLHRLARRGIEVERQPRKVTIHALRLLNLENERMECQVHCTKGTYVRTLAQDIGAALGYGAHIVALRRTEVEPFDALQMVTLVHLHELADQDPAALDALLLPVDKVIAAWPAVRLRHDVAHYLLQGQPVMVPQAPTQGWVRLYQGDDHHFLGVGEILHDGRIALRRLIRGSLQRHALQ